MSDYDVIIVGTGAGGGTLARHLAPSGKRILLLERGDWLLREPRNWSTADVFIDNRYISRDSWTDGSGRANHPGRTHRGTRVITPRNHSLRSRFRGDPE